jgi:tetratricopeptide (TPR) repeat protein
MKCGIIGSGGASVRAVAVGTLLFALSMSQAPALHAAVVSQQEPSGRYRVLVVPLESSALDKRFGEKVSRELSTRLEEYNTHAPIPEREFKRALKRYEIKQEDLNAIKARQLGNLMGAQVVFYGTVTVANAAGNVYAVDAAFIDVTTGDQVGVPEVRIPDKSDTSVERVADEASAAFQEQVRFVRARQFCAEYVGSQQPENALRNCNEALSINGTSVHALFNKGLAFRLMYETENSSAGTNGWADSAVTYFEEVLEYDPGHRPAMQNAAYIYSKTGDAEKASELYKLYLELDPANVPVRLTVAYDMAQAGLLREAIDIIEAGLDYVEDDPELLQYLGDYALRYSADDSTYLDRAISAYSEVLRIKGEETDPAVIRNVIAALTQASRTDEALAFSEEALESHSDNPQLWSLYADALGRAGRHSEAVVAMNEVLQLDPAYPRAYLKRGQFKLESGDDTGAMADFNLAIDSGSSTDDEVFRFFWARAIPARNAGRLAEATVDFERASQFVPADKRQELEFWWGYTYYQLGDQLAKPENASVNQLRRAQANFQAAIAHFNRAGSVKAEIPGLKDAADKWLLNVDARIRQLTRS